MHISALYVLLGFVIFCKAGIFVPPAEWCLPSSHLKELSGCIAMTDLEEECGGKPTNDEKLDCYCTQEMLSAYFDCQDDVTRCLESHMFDREFEYKVKRWHEQCDDRMTTSVTTPIVTSLTTTWDIRECQRLQSSCMSADYETNLCSQTYLPSSSLSFISCECQPSVWSLISECQYDGNISCKRTTAAESNIYGYSFCSSFWSRSETLAPIDITSAFRDDGAAATAIQITSSAREAHIASIASMITSTRPGITRMAQPTGQNQRPLLP